MEWLITLLVPVFIGIFLTGCIAIYFFIKERFFDKEKFYIPTTHYTYTILPGLRSPFTIYGK